MEGSVRALQAISQFAIDLVYPCRCAGCGRRGTWLCEECDAALARFVSPFCHCCGVPNSINACQCDTTPAILSRVRSVGPYAGWLREAIIRFKYEGEWARAQQFGPLLAESMMDLVPCDALVPVPLHPRRYRQRGYNQARLLANQVGGDLGIDVRDALLRRRATNPQARLGVTDRVSNVKGAFALHPDENVEGQDLVLVDDVITTGSTLATCATALYGAGARSVAVVTIARELQNPRGS